MKTFDIEYKDLLDWYKEQLEEARSTYDEFDGYGHDGGPLCKAERALGNEYQEKLYALREKYGVEAPPEPPPKNILTKERQREIHQQFIQRLGKNEN